MSAVSKKENRLTRMVAEVLGVTPDLLSEESSPETISGWDSLGHLNLVIALEEEFGVNLSAEDVLAMGKEALSMDGVTVSTPSPFTTRTSTRCCSCATTPMSVMRCAFRAEPI